MKVDLDRLRSDLVANAEFGGFNLEEGRGRTVLTGSDADLAARERLVDSLVATGMTVSVDPVGNISGRWIPEGVDPDTAPVAMGSHLDSVPRGGIFDGPLGVYGALEAVRVIQSAGVNLDRPLEVVSFTEEEGGRFGIGTLGSSVATGSYSVSDALALKDDEGYTLAERLEGIDFDGDDSIDPSTWDAWLELHIEQGNRLESAEAAVGIVDAITGITNCTVEIFGEADHAGATPMDDRADALVAAGEFVQAVEEITSDVAADYPTAVASVGRHTVEPNVRNSIPGHVEMEMDIRDVTHETMNRLVNRFRSRLERISQNRPVDVRFDQFRDDAPSHMSDRCINAALDAVTRCDIDAVQLHSAAMHDTANISQVTESGLLFAPSKDGISHNPKEWTNWSDCATATRALAETAARLAGGNSEC